SDLNALAADGAGGVIAVGSGGAIHRRSASGEWSETRRPSGASAWTAACVAPDGRGMVVGDGPPARTTDHGATWSEDVPPPGSAPDVLDAPHYTSIGCRGDRFTVMGDWSAATRVEDSSWTKASAPRSGSPAQVAQVRSSEWGTWIAVGAAGYLARSEDGVTFIEQPSPVDGWGFLGVAAGPDGRWWAVGEAGLIASSTDDGRRWSVQQSGSREDLYAVRFVDAHRGIAVGAHGTALLTREGGADWRDASPGGDAYLGDALWLDSSHVLAVGGAGRALVLTTAP
ncbi:MAG TPA: YCF48-related protein, partial [Myxococcaceae bacterium]|nr:YCF48-related protein [Myxococcaceae bacterium]